VTRVLASMILWDVTRSSAFVAFACYTVSVAWGISLTARSFRPPVAPQFDYHRFVAMLGFLAMVTHITTSYLDAFAHIRLKNFVFVGADWKILLGVIAMWIAMALPLSFHLKQRKILINQKFWRNFHYLGYSVWALALVHGMWQGSDTPSKWAIAAYGASAMAIGGVAWWRWFEAPLKKTPKRPAAKPQASAEG
jgi:hypothetical protein